MKNLKQRQAGAFVETPHESGEDYHEPFLQPPTFSRDRIGRALSAGFGGHLWYPIVCNNIACRFKAWIRFDALSVALKQALSTEVDRG